MTTLRVILDEILVPAPTGTSRYAEDLTRALIETAPAGCEVAGIVASSPQSEYDLLHERLPGLGELYKSALARRELTSAWQHGFTRLPAGMVHAPSLLAPMAKHDRLHATGHQIVVTAHDAIAWTHPEAIGPRGVAWFEAMAKRAVRYADAIVVPTHAVAAQWGERFDLHDRIRVIGGAVSPRLALPPDPDRVAADLGLPERFVLTAGGLESRKGIDSLIEALALLSDEVPLLVLGAEDAQLEAAAMDLAPGRVRPIGDLSDAELAVVYSRAAAFVFPSIEEGFGLPMLEAFHFGTPVVHSDAPALVEVAGGAGLVVERDDPAGYPQRLADALESVLTDAALAVRLSTLGTDRAGLFSWRSSAEKVWQLHADL